MDGIDIYLILTICVAVLFVILGVIFHPFEIKDYVAVYDGAVCNDFEKYDSCGYNLYGCTDGRVFVCVTNVELIEVSK